jgi:hypothetical protein
MQTFEDWFSSTGQYLDIDTRIEPEQKGFARAGWCAHNIGIEALQSRLDAVRALVHSRQRPTPGELLAALGPERGKT